MALRPPEAARPIGRICGAVRSVSVLRVTAALTPNGRTDDAVSLSARLAALDTPTLLRRGLVALALLGMAGAALELLFTRHWSTIGMNVAWLDIGVCLVAAVILAIASSPRAAAPRRAILVARWLAALGLVLAVVGVVLHVWANLQAGPADPTLGATWETIPPLEQLWDAVAGTVGKAPSLAPGALAETSLILLLATLRHPALDARLSAA